MKVQSLRGEDRQREVGVGQWGRQGVTWGLEWKRAGELDGATESVRKTER